MSDFFDRVHHEALQLDDIAEQRAFYERLAESLPQRYADGYDAAAEMSRPGATDKRGAAVVFLSFQDGSMQGFFDYLQHPCPQEDIDEASAVLNDTFGFHTTTARHTSDMSVYETIMYANSRNAPALPALCLYTSVTSELLQTAS